MTEAQYETKVEFYKNKKAMQKGIKKEQKRGWTVISTEAVDEGYSGCKTCLFGCLFLPLGSGRHGVDVQWPIGTGGK